ncbi:hypothetical protein RAS1_26410 [Phycisphaerae bacterium RAS1]|nr:hypothetical protein RAS1_26410 [Phycisphaerae bacterium RAS1]
MSDPQAREMSVDTPAPEVGPRRPYTLIYVGDLGSEGRLSGLTPLDKENFAAVMSKARPAVPVAIKDPITGGAQWEFKLAFDSMKAFEPAGLLAQVSNARTRLTIREKLIDRRTGSLTEAELESALSSAASMDATLGYLTDKSIGAAGGGAASAAASAGGASILDLVDAPDESKRVAADVERLATAAGDSSKRVSGAESGRLDLILRRLELELTNIADALLKHSDVRRLEVAWRSVKFLVDRIDFRAGVKLCVLDATRASAVSRVIDHIVNPAFNGDIPTPGLLLFDFSIENMPDDIARIDELGQHAASLPVPAAFNIEPGFFNVKSIALIKNLPNLAGVLDGFQFAKWKALREKPYAKALFPVVGRFVLRPPHEAKAGGREFTCKESMTAISHVVWGAGHLALGMAAARSFAKHGWPSRMFGAEAGKVDDLAIIPNPNDPQRPWGPGDAFIPDAKLDDFPDAGMNLLQAVLNKDYCILLGGVSAARPLLTAETSKNQAMLEVSLPYQQLNNITASWICEQQLGLRGKNPDEIQRTLLYGLADLMKLSEKEAQEAILVGVGADPNQPGQTIVQVRLTPPPRVCPGGLNVDFGFAVPS